MDENELLKALGRLLSPHMTEQQKHDLPAGFTLGVGMLHGQSGLFSVPGLERDIFSTRITVDGLMSALPAKPTQDTHPVVGYLTGFTAAAAHAEQDAPCDDPPGTGQMKSCFQGTAFGRIARKTGTIDLSATGERINRGEMFDLQLANDPVLPKIADLLIPPSVTGSFRDALSSEVAAKMLALGVEFEDVLSHMLWTGTPLNNSANGGYMEFLGLEGLVTVTHTDIITGANCPSLASDIKDFGSRRVDQAAADLFNYMTYLWQYVNHNAKKMNMNPVRWAFVMREELFREITYYWPCVYASYRCGATNNQLSNNVDAMAMRQMTSDMFNGKYLIIDNVQVPVIIDDAMPIEENGDNALVPNGGMRSDIYLLPFTVKGGMQVLYMEYYNFSGPGGALSEAANGRIGNLLWSDGGRWLWTPRQTLYCIDLVSLIKPRLRLLTPHLAGKIENVVILPLQRMREPFVGDSYFVDGGNTSFSSGLPYSYSSIDVRGG